MREGTVASVDGVEIAYDVRGSGEPALVFVHGWSGRRSHWDLQVDEFAADRTVVRIDLAGHGTSGRDRGVWSIDAFADDVIAVVDHLGLDAVVLIGHSLGGSVIVAAAQRLGPRVVGLVGIDTWSALGSTVTVEQMEASVLLPEMRADWAEGGGAFARLECGPTAPPELVDRIVAEVAEFPAHIGIGIMETAMQRGTGALEQGLKDLTVPRWAISCETFRPKDPAILAAHGVTDVQVPGTGHYLMLEDPQRFNARLAEVLSAIG